MTPQSEFIVIAPIIPEKRAALETLLVSMNVELGPGTPSTGIADRDNALVPFGQFGALHVARFVIVADETLGDFARMELCVPEYPVTLAFIGDCDGSADAFLSDLADHSAAAAGLREIFGHCEGVEASTDLLAWMRQRSVKPAAAYVNWLGRTTLQARKESALRIALQAELVRYPGPCPAPDADVRAVRDHLVKFYHERPELKFHADQTPVWWWICNWLHFLIVPALLLLPWVIAWPFIDPFNWYFVLVALVFGALALQAFVYLSLKATVTFAVIVAAAIIFVGFLFFYPPIGLLVVGTAIGFLLLVRHIEKREPEVIPKPTEAHDTALAWQEDHDVTNQFTIVGSVKPGAFRRNLLIVILWFTQYGARHVYNRGFLARIQTIHFASWTFIDGKRRVLFISNYDGSRQAYMDDFINKVGWGLNIIFGNGLGYPRTRWMVLDGAKNELRFKDTNRRHQIPTQVWYKAYPGLTAFDLARNTRIRKGLERRFISRRHIRAWLRDL